MQRLGKKAQGKNRALLVKFSDKEDKLRFMGKKKGLKDNQDIKDDQRFGDKVLVFEDITIQRQRLLCAVWDLPNVEFAFGKDGYILAKKRQDKFVKIESADDMSHPGVNELDYKDFYGAE